VSSSVIIVCSVENNGRAVTFCRFSLASTLWRPSLYMLRIYIEGIGVAVTL